MATTTATPPESAEEVTGKKGKKGKNDPNAKKSKKKLIIMVVVGLLVAFAGYHFTLGKSSAPAVVPPPEPGAVIKLDSITLNLAEGHLLKLGLALQLTSTAVAGHGGEFDGSQAMDLAIAQLSNRRLTDLNSAVARSQAKKELVEAVEKAYHENVMDVYFTEFVMQ